MRFTEEIERILNKKRATGKDLGRLILLIDVENNNYKKEICTSIKGATCEQIDFETAASKLNEGQLSIYNGFVGLYHIIHTYNHLGQGCYQQALRAFYRLMLIISKPTIFAKLKSMSDEIDSKKATDDIETFMISLKMAYAIRQFFLDVEELHDIKGMSKTYDVWANLDEYIASYNDVVRQIIKTAPLGYDEILRNLPIISEKDYLPLEHARKRARKYIGKVESFCNRSISTEFYEMYLEN